jgi:hypothetical protein
LKKNRKKIWDFTRTGKIFSKLKKNCFWSHWMFPEFLIAAPKNLIKFGHTQKKNSQPSNKRDVFSRNKNKNHTFGGVRNFWTFLIATMILRIFSILFGRRISVSDIRKYIFRNFVNSREACRVGRRVGGAGGRGVRDEALAFLVLGRVREEGGGRREKGEGWWRGRWKEAG